MASHPRSSVFHRREWLQALALTYDYKPLVLTPNSQLTNGVVFSEINSRITGTRLVSLPFSDHCEPLIAQPEEAVDLTNWLRAESGNRRWRYLELRPLSLLGTFEGLLGSGTTYWFHTLDLSPPRPDFPTLAQEFNATPHPACRTRTTLIPNRNVRTASP